MDTEGNTEGAGASDPVILLEGLNGIEANLVRGLLEGAGIPCLLDGPDFDVAELGRPSHDMIRGQRLLVPRTAFDEACRLLDEVDWKGRAEP